MEAVLPNPLQDWNLRNGERAKLERYYRLFLSETQLAANNLEAIIEASQRAQATGLQIAIEQMRRRKGESGGVILWQFNEPWPAISWAIVDYFRRPKLAYRLLKQWYSPLLISLKFDLGVNWQPGDLFEAEVWGVNDSPDAARGACFVSLDGAQIFEAKDLNLPSDSAVMLGRIAHRLKKKPQELSVTFWDSQKMLTQNSYNLDWSDTAKTGLWQRLRRRMAERTLQ